MGYFDLPSMAPLSEEVGGGGFGRKGNGLDSEAEVEEAERRN